MAATASAGYVEQAEDWLLLRWANGPEICLCVFALLGAVRVRKLEKQQNQEKHWIQSLVYTFMLSFGGGILGPFLLGKPPVVLVNDLLIPAAVIAWFLVHRLEGLIFSVVQTPGVNQVLVVMGETFRANAMCGLINVAATTLKASKYYPIPVFGPVLLGTIGGSGGLFLPLDRGLQGIGNGAPWPLQSAFYGAFFFHMTKNDPGLFGSTVRELLGSSEADVPQHAQALVVLFFTTVALLQSVKGPAFNPFTPVHNVLYAITGLERPGAAAKPPAAVSARPEPKTNSTQAKDTCSDEQGAQSTKTPAELSSRESKKDS